MAAFGAGQRRTATGYADLVTRPIERAADGGVMGVRRCDSMESSLDNAGIRQRFVDR